jgi:hypothetical protein
MRRGDGDFATAAGARDVAQLDGADRFKLYRASLGCASRRGFWQRERKRQVDAAVGDRKSRHPRFAGTKRPESRLKSADRERQANRFSPARTVVQGETGPWKDARAGGANPDRLAKPARGLALERQADAVGAHQLVKAD